MGFGQTTLIAVLVANGVLLALFVYLGIENFQLSKADETNAIEYRKPWVDKLMAIALHHHVRTSGKYLKLRYSE